MISNVLMKSIGKITVLVAVLLTTISYASVRADDLLPIAPKRYDIRDELPTAPFVSITGEDPRLPGDDRPQTAIATKGKPASAKNKKVANASKTNAKSSTRSPASKKEKSRKPNSNSKGASKSSHKTQKNKSKK